MSEADEKNAPEKKPQPKPEHGADSQLRCYNATSWRLDQLFDTEDEPGEDSKK